MSAPNALQNQESNLQVITELRKKQAAYEEEIESLKNDVENFKAQLDNERKYAFSPLLFSYPVNLLFS